MTGPNLAALRRDRLLLASVIFAVAYATWNYSVQVASRVPGMGASQMVMPLARPWQFADLGFTFVMWAVMMVAMMTPSAAPMILTFAYVARRRHGAQSPLANSILFMMAYLIIWVVFSLAATLLQWILQTTLLISSHMIAVAAPLGGLFLVLAGIYQFTPLKRACLSRCRTPLGFLLTEWREGPGGALIMGLRHGALCTGCCWSLMLLLFVFGVMNLVWVAFIAILVLVEKALPAGRLLGQAVGLMAIAWGFVVLTMSS